MRTNNIILIGLLLIASSGNCYDVSGLGPAPSPRRPNPNPREITVEEYEFVVDAIGSDSKLLEHVNKYWQDKKITTVELKQIKTYIELRDKSSNLKTVKDKLDKKLKSKIEPEKSKRSKYITGKIVTHKKKVSEYDIKVVAVNDAGICYESKVNKDGTFKIRIDRDYDDDDFYQVGVLVSSINWVLVTDYRYLQGEDTGVLRLRYH
jgi:hypothetical protein